MPVYQVQTIFKEVFYHTIRADSEKEAIDIAHNLSCDDGSPNDTIWYDSDATEIDETEADND